MMTYTDLFAHYKENLRRAITQYQHRFTKKPMPTHRARNIVDLIAALEDTTHTDETLTLQMNAIIKTFHTGIRLFGRWWIIATGNSKLKDALTAVLGNSVYQHDAFLKAQIHELRCQAQMLTDIERIEFGDLDMAMDKQALQKELITAQKSIRQLSTALDESREDNTRFKHQLERLRLQNVVLYDKNQELQQSNRNLQRRLGDAEEEEAELLPKSPSETIYGSFKQFSINNDT